MGRVRFLGIVMIGMALLWPGRTGALATGPGTDYTARLTGGEEVPPRTTPGGGEMAIHVSADGQSLAYAVLVVDIANVTMGHIHLGAKGANGDIVLPLALITPPPAGRMTPLFGPERATAAQLVGPLQGRPLTDLIAEMEAGNAYVNIHTGGGTTPATLQPGDLPPGELRGQIVRVSAPATTPAPPLATPPTMPNTGGGYGPLAAVLPWAALTVLLTLGLGLAFRAHRLR